AELAAEVAARPGDQDRARALIGRLLIAFVGLDNRQAGGFREEMGPLLVASVVGAHGPAPLRSGSRRRVEGRLTPILRVRAARYCPESGRSRRLADDRGEADDLVGSSPSS